MPYAHVGRNAKAMPLNVGRGRYGEDSVYNTSSSYKRANNVSSGLLKDLQRWSHEARLQARRRPCLSVVVALLLVLGVAMVVEVDFMVEGRTTSSPLSNDVVGVATTIMGAPEDPAEALARADTSRATSPPNAAETAETAKKKGSNDNHDADADANDRKKDSPVKSTINKADPKPQPPPQRAAKPRIHLRGEDKAAATKGEGSEDDGDATRPDSSSSATTDARARALRVRDALGHAWAGYHKRAFGHDEVNPVTNSTNDSWGGLGATLFDALDTLYLADMKEEFAVAVERVLKVDFDVDHKASFFEFTIRYLGGMLGAYELSRDARLLEKSVEFAEKLLPAFTGAQGLPYGRVNLRTGKASNPSWTAGAFVLGEIGTFQLEFSYLAHHAKRQDLQDRVDKVMRAVTRLAAEYPNTGGLFPVYISPETVPGQSQQPDGSSDGEDDKSGLSFGSKNSQKIVSFGGLGDSFYEYLLKYPLLHTSQRGPKTGEPSSTPVKVDHALLQASRDLFAKSMETAQKYLMFRPKADGSNFLGEWNLATPVKNEAQSEGGPPGSLSGKFEHLACFLPGTLALTTLEKRLGDDSFSQAQVDSHMIMARDLVEVCRELYSSTGTGIGPEAITFEKKVTTEGRGWAIMSGKYMLRPEYLESLFIMHAVTGNATYREWAWEVFQAIEHYCKTPVAFSGLRDVNDRVVSDAGKDDSMQSYFFSETLKYLLMMFPLDPQQPLVDLSKMVFTTEGHILGRVGS